jgi:hypothetical protein
MFGFICPFLTSIFFPYDGVMEPCLWACTGTMAALTLIEIMDVFHNGRNYFKTKWNYMDLLFILCWYTYFFIKWSDDFKYEQTAKEYSNEIVMMNLLKVTITFLGFIKIVSFCRVFEGFASLINMLAEVIIDLTYYQIFFLLLLVGFTVIQKINSMNFGPL